MARATQGGRAAGHGGEPLLSICIPTYARPDDLRTALASALAVRPADAARVEVVVSDNSEDDRTERVFTELTAGHPGPVRYHRNVPGVGMVGNFNRCVELAGGSHVLILHDDDHLLPGAVATMLSWLARTDRPVLLFGVRVVDGDGGLIRRQRTRRVEYLPPGPAVQRLLTRSSYVRFPAIVVARTAYDDIGGFDASLGGVCDLDMWTRLAERSGILRLPDDTVAYVVHAGADTETVFRPETIERIDRVFDRVRGSGLFPPARVDRFQSTFLHQFALAGAARRLRARDLAGARERLDLLELDRVRQLGPSWGWTPVRAGMRLVTALAPRADRAQG